MADSVEEMRAACATRVLTLWFNVRTTLTCRRSKESACVLMDALHLGLPNLALHEMCIRGTGLRLAKVTSEGGKRAATIDLF